MTLADAALRVALPRHLAGEARTRLAADLGPDGPAPADWRDGPRAGDVLLVAPHEMGNGGLPDDLAAVLGAADWSWVHLTSAGTDFVDVPRWPGDRLLTRSWRCYAAPLAEYALGAMLTHQWRDGSPWNGRPVAADAGLWGARVGVAGYGEVGRRVAEVSAALGASVLALSRTPRPSRGRIAHTTSPAAVLDADHLVIALPLNAGTRGLFGPAVLARARPGLHLVNVSRAQIVCQRTLATLCAEGRMHATLDVTDPEPLPPGHVLRTLPQVRVSPHVAWRSRRSDAAFTEDFAAIWQRLRDGEPPPDGAVAAGAAERARTAVLHTTSRRRDNTPR
ncbi:NAD(P)-dependent oxidoreductase [Actinomadura fibrosa]|uniref:NAD(P)-dependent oxidoreductase n=1 Tax=Actinomadura fibrosa TaxID=111802 RepID=A0ABW2XV20_9ACTN|nr:NAD(P)-dependent oxidoreductase [Actinomadura fibrosa]